MYGTYWWTYGYADSDVYAYADRYTHRNAYGYPDADQDCHGHPDTDGDEYTVMGWPWWAYPFAWLVELLDKVRGG